MQNSRKFTGLSYLIVCVLLLSFPHDTSASEYKGQLTLKLLVTSGTQYTYASNFSTKEQTLYSPIIASSDSGQISNRYFFELKISSLKEDNYFGSIRVYENLREKSDSLDTLREILYYPISGTLYQRSQFELISSNKPTINISLFMDKIFSMEEIKQRFRDKQAKTYN